MSQGPKAARLGVGHGHSDVAQASQLPSLAVPQFVPLAQGLTSESKKGNSEGFLEPAPRGLSVLGRSEGGGEGPERRRRKQRRDKGPIHL